MTDQNQIAMVFLAAAGMAALISIPFIVWDHIQLKRLAEKNDAEARKMLREIVDKAK